MACAALMDQQIQPMYFPLLDTPSTPGVRNLQILIERAWRDGKLCSSCIEILLTLTSRLRPGRG